MMIKCETCCATFPRREGLGRQRRFCRLCSKRRIKESNKRYWDSKKGQEAYKRHKQTEKYKKRREEKMAMNRATAHLDPEGYSKRVSSEVKWREEYMKQRKEDGR